MENPSHSRNTNSRSSSSLPKKACNGSGGFSYSSGKTGGNTTTTYDDVFGGPPRFGAPTLSPRLEDYCEIFAGFNGSSNSAVSSIPVLDLPLVDDRDVYFDVRSQGFDYREVFGGFNDLDFAPSYEELFMQRSTADDGNSSDDAWTPEEVESFSGGTEHSGKSPSFSNGRDSFDSIDGSTEFNISYNKSSHISNTNMSSGVIRVADLSAIPGYTVAVDEMIGGGGTTHLKTETGPAYAFEGKERERAQKYYNGAMSFPSESFVTVSEIGLRTHPTGIPPPSRPPPLLKSDFRNSASNSRTSGSQGSADGSSPPFFDVEVDASSAAVREAMVKAEAKLKSAKEMLERKKDGARTTTKQTSINNRMIEEEKLSHTASLPASKSLKDKHGNTSLCSQRSAKSDGNDEWEDATHFVELVRTEQPTNANENSNGKDVPIPLYAEFFDQKLSWAANVDWEKQQERARGDRAIKVASRYKRHEERFAEKVPEEPRDEKSRHVELQFDIIGNKSPDLLRPEENSLVTEKNAKQKKELHGEVNANLIQNQQLDRKNQECVFDWEKNARKLRETLGLADNEITLEVKEIRMHGQTNESKTKLNEALKRMEEETRIKEIQVKEENERREREAYEKAENERRLKAALEQEEKEKRIKKGREKEENERREAEAREKAEQERKRKEQEVLELRRKEALEMEEKKRRMREAYEKAEHQRKMKEQQELELRRKEASEMEEKNRRMREAYEKAEHERIMKVALEKEKERRIKEAREKEENERRIKEAREKAELEQRLKEALQQEEKERQNKEREENERRAKEVLEQAENERKLKEALEQKRVKEAHEKEENERKMKESLERKRVKEAREKEENEKKLREAIELEEKEKRLIEAFEKADSERRLKEDLEQEEMRLQEAKEREERESDKRRRDACEIEKACEASKEVNGEQWSKESLSVSSEEDDKVTYHKSANKEKEEEEGSSLEESISEEACPWKVFEKNLKDASQKEGVNELDAESISFKRNVEVTQPGEHGGYSQLNGESGDKAASLTENIRGKFDQKNKEFESTKETSALKGDSVEERSQNENIRKAGVGHDQKNPEDSKCAPILSSGFRKQENKYTQQHERGNINKIQAGLNQEPNTERPLPSRVSEQREKETERLKRERVYEMERLRKLEEEKEREREREKDRMAFDQRALADARERLEKACAEAREKSLPDKLSMEARHRAERAAVERATTEARERAAERMERSVSDKQFQSAGFYGERMERSGFDKQFQNSVSFGTSKYQNPPGSEAESPQRYTSRLERHRRTADRVAKALAEKNMRDLVAQREQAERIRISETLDAEVKRWSSGKEGNIRALLSTLQYILGSESGWQPLPLTEVITSAAVKRAYRKATLYVHPDKLQQRGANIQQKYICEKVFDLLKEAWNRFNSEER